MPQSDASAWTPVDEPKPDASAWTPVDEAPAAPKNWRDQLGDFGEHGWNMLKSTVTGPIHLVRHPIDTASAILHDAGDELSKGKQAYDQGNYDVALEHMKYAIPVAGPLLRQMREETDRGDYGAALGDAAGFIGGGKLLGAVPGAIKGAASLPGKAVEFARTPGNLPIAVGAGQVVGAGGALIAGHPFAAGVAGMRGAENIAKGVELRVAGAKAAAEAADAESKAATAAAAPPVETIPPEWDQFAKDIGRKSFSDLPAHLQTSIRAGWAPVEEPAVAASPAAASPASGKARLQRLEEELAAESKAATAGAPKTTLQLIDEDLAARRAAKAAAAPEPPDAAPPAAAPAATPPAPAAPAAPAAALPPMPPVPDYVTPGQYSARVQDHAAANGVSEDIAAQQLQGHIQQIDRSSTNRMLHAIGAERGFDHAALSDMAKATYGDGLGKITHEDMLDLTKRLANEQATQEPLAKKTAAAPAQTSIGAMMPAAAETPVEAALKASLKAAKKRRAAKVGIGDLMKQ